jgi:DNA-directed RNA polymerase specialized sigma24 family protein
MTAFSIKEINKILFPFVKKIIQQGQSEQEWNKDAEDIVQESWRILFEKYPIQSQKSQEARPLLFTIAKNEGYKFLRKNKSKVLHNDNHINSLSEEKHYEKTFLNEDLSKILSHLSEKYAFIIQKSMEYEQQYSQHEIVKLISNEYTQRFKTLLTIENYRQLKKRAKDSLLYLIKKQNL